MQAVCIKVATSSSVAKPNFLGRPNTLNLSEKQYFFSGHCLSKHKMRRYASNLRGHDSPGRPVYACGCNEKERTVLAWCSIFDWQKARKNERQLDTAVERRAALHKIQFIYECWSALASRYKYHKRKIRFHSLYPIAWTDWQDHTFRDHFYSVHLENVIQRWQNPNRDDESQWGFLSM